MTTATAMLRRPELRAKIREQIATDEIHETLQGFVRDDLGPKWTPEHGVEFFTLRLLADQVAAAA